VEAEPSSELGHSGLTLAVAERQEQRRGPIHRSNGIPV
jgi:hypothetical protein